MQLYCSQRSISGQPQASYERERQNKHKQKLVGKIVCSIWPEKNNWVKYYVTKEIGFPIINTVYIKCRIKFITERKSLGLTNGLVIVSSLGGRRFGTIKDLRNLVSRKTLLSQH